MHSIADRSRFLSSCRALGALAAFGSLLVSAGAGCAVSAEDSPTTSKDDRAVTDEAAACTTAATPIPAGWKVRNVSSFAVAAPEEGLLVSETTAMIQFYSREPGTSLAAFERRDLTSLDDAVGSWKRALGDGCVMTNEPTTYLCDQAVRVHASCDGVRPRTVDVLVVRHQGAIYSASCELKGGESVSCDSFLQTLRITDGQAQ